MKKVVKKYEGGGIYANNSKIVPKSKTVKPATKPVVKPPVKKNATAGKATAYKTEKRTYVDPSSPAYSKLSARERNENTANQVRKSTGTPLYYSTGTKVAYNKKNNTKTIVNYKADGTKQTKVINYSKPAVAKKAPVKTPVGTPVKTAYDVLKDKQTAVKNPRVGTPVKGTATTNPKKTVTVKKATVKTNPTKTVEEPITPLATKKPSEVAPSVSSINMSPVTNTKSTADRVKAPVKKSTPSMGERLTGYKGTSRPVTSTTTNTPTTTTPTPTETTSGRVSLLDRIKGNIAKRKMKRMNKLSEQVGQSRAMGSYAQPTMKKGGCTSCKKTMKKMAMGGSTKIVGKPKYGNNPRTQEGRIPKTGGSIQTTSKSSAQLKREGSAQKAKGAAMKAKGQAMKYQGQQQKNNSLGIVDKFNTRAAATGIKLKESLTGSENRSINQQKTLDADMAIHRANSAKDAYEKNKVKEMQKKGSYSKIGFKKGGPVKKYAKGGFPDLNKDGEVTKADILKGRGVIKKKGGATMDKYQKGGTKKPMMSPAKIKVTPGSKKPSYNEVFKTKKK